MSPILLSRGSIVVVDFASTNPGSGVRPAVVVQNDRDNARMANTIVAQITSNVSRSHEPTQLLIDQGHANWGTSGLCRPSVVNCSSVATVQQQHVTRVIGQLSSLTMREIDACLKAAFGLT